MSPERLARYVVSAGGNKEAALRLYQRNTQLSEALYGPLQGIEILVRNAFNTQLCKTFGDRWFEELPTLGVFKADDDGSVPNTTLKLNDAMAFLEKRGKPVTAGRMVAELSFGFWVSVCARRYMTDLWLPCLSRPFKGLKLSRADVHLRLDDIRNLRNRVAHHECIVNRDLKSDYDKIMEASKWFCGATTQWIDSGSTFLQRLNSK